MPPIVLLMTQPGGGAGITRALDEAGHHVHGCHTIGSACETLERQQIDLALIGQSESDASVAVAAMRSRTRAPIVLIDSGRAGELDCALAAGADDFLSKPFTARQLHARIKVALNGRREARAITVGGIQIDGQGRRARLDGKALRLSRLEFDLLRCLASRAGQVVSRQELARCVWPENTSNLGHTMNVHLSWLRRKLGDTAADPRYLHTIRGIGFTLAYVERPDGRR